MKLFSLTCGFFAALLALQDVARAEEKSPHWTLELSKPSPAVGEEIEVILTAQLPRGWILYSSDFTAEIGPQPTQFLFSASDSYGVVGPVASIKPKRKKDKTWDTELGYFEERAEFRQKIKVLKPGFAITGRIKGQLCNETDGTCSLFEEKFSAVSPR